MTVEENVTVVINIPNPAPTTKTSTLYMRVRRTRKEKKDLEVVNPSLIPRLQVTQKNTRPAVRSLNE